MGFAVAARRGASSLQYRAHGEVILSAGAIESPKLLQLSGIGPGELLRKLGVSVVVENAAVGAKLNIVVGIFGPARKCALMNFA